MNSISPSLLYLPLHHHYSVFLSDVSTYSSSPTRSLIKTPTRYKQTEYNDSEDAIQK